MSWFSKAVKPVVNVFRAPDRILHKTLKGDIKGALSVAVYPIAGSQATRDRVLRRSAGAAAGAAGGFLTGGPAGAVTGGIIGGLRASEGRGKIKDAVGSFALGAGSGLLAGGAAGALGAPEYGGYAGKWGASLTASSSPFDPVTGEFTEKYLSSTGGGSSLWGSVAKTAGTIGKTALGVSPILSSLQAGQPVSEEVPMNWPFASYVPNHPLSSEYVPQGDVAASGSGSNMPLLIGLGALILVGVIYGKH